MAYTLTLNDARTKLTYLAALDGKTGSNGRHSPTNLGLVLNMAYRELMSRAGQLGLPHGLTTTTGTLGSAFSSEDFISLDVPNGAAEVVGVDVRCDGGRWEKLDPITWEQRRDVCSICPPHGIGFWATREAPSVSGSSLAAGKLAVWPTRLAGLPYTLSQVRQWVEISSGTDVFLLHEGWESWLLNKAAMAVAQRDTNKRTNWDTARDAWLTADALLKAQAARHSRGGIEPTPYFKGRL